MPSILQDAGADGLMFGMGEKSVLEIAANLKAGKRGPDVCKQVRGTAYFTKNAEDI